MPNHPRVESKYHTSFCSIRCKHSRLWMINNKSLQEQILARSAQCAERYNAKIYAIAIEGNHIHDLGGFPELNRSDYMKDRNSIVGKLIPRFYKKHEAQGTFEKNTV